MQARRMHPSFRGLIRGTEALLLFATIVTETMLCDGDRPTQVGSFPQRAAISADLSCITAVLRSTPSSMFKSEEMLTAALRLDTSSLRRATSHDSDSSGRR